MEQQVQHWRVAQDHAGIRKPQQRAVFHAADAFTAVAVFAARSLRPSAANLQDNLLRAQRGRCSCFLERFQNTVNVLQPLVVAIAILKVRGRTRVEGPKPVGKC
jgi:hypothetical protein